MLQHDGQRLISKIEPALKESVEAQEERSLSFVAVAEDLHTINMFLHTTAEKARKTWYWSLCLQRLCRVRREQRANDQRTSALTIVDPKLLKRVGGNRSLGCEEIQKPVDNSRAMEYEMHRPTIGAVMQPCFDRCLAECGGIVALLYELLEAY